MEIGSECGRYNGVCVTCVLQNVNSLLSLVESVPSSVRTTRIDPVAVEFPSTIKPVPMALLLSDPSLDAICPGKS